MRLFGLIGNPLGHSMSAAYFTEKFRREGIDAEYRAFELPDIESLSALPENIEGFNVTIPYKRAIIPFLDAVSPEAAAVGAVNCVLCSNGRRTGYNTDVAGIRRSLDMLVGNDEIAGALVLGTGGASAAVQYVLAERSIPFALVSRDPARGNITYDTLDAGIIAESRLIINTTPIGMYPDVDAAPPLPYDAIGRGHLLFDLVYNPRETRFLKSGRAAGACTMDGMTMFIEQAEASWRIWSGNQC